MVKLSVCIPTFNRSRQLENCLYSIFIATEQSKIDFEICVSDNNSTDDTEQVVRHMQGKLPISYSKNVENIGIPRNFLKVVSMATGEFAWLLGDDDLVMPDGIQRLIQLINENPDVDFIYANSYHLDNNLIEQYEHPFNTCNLPLSMVRFSDYDVEGRLPFLDLINPKISFDFLGGMFLSVFRKSLWDEHKHVLDVDAIKDNRTFSHFDNTFPHVKIFAMAFADSQAYFNPRPLSICLAGVREWIAMYPLVRSVRLIQALEIYREIGLSFCSYYVCRNFALKYFAQDLYFLIRNSKVSGFSYISPFKLILTNSFYPNFYYSIFSALAKRIAKIFK